MSQVQAYTVQNQNALNQLPEYIKFNYSKHALEQAKINSRDIYTQLPDKITKDKIFIAKSWYEGNRLAKVEIRLSLSKNLDMVLIYLPDAKLVKTVYKTRKNRR